MNRVFNFLCFPYGACFWLCTHVPGFWSVNGSIETVLTPIGQIEAETYALDLRMVPVAVFTWENCRRFIIRAKDKGSFNRPELKLWRLKTTNQFRLTGERNAATGKLSSILYSTENRNVRESTDHNSSAFQDKANMSIGQIHCLSLHTSFVLVEARLDRDAHEEKTTK